MSATITSLAKIVLIIILVLINGFFVAAEFSLVKIRATRVVELAADGNRRAKAAKAILNHLHAYLSACQLGITLASLGLGWIGEPTVAHFLERPLRGLGMGELVDTVSYVIAFLFVTVLHIVIGELAPKSVAIHRPESTVLFAASPLALFRKTMFPLIWMLHATANLLMRMVGIDPSTEGEQAHTEDEIRILMNHSHRSGFIDSTEMALFDNVFDFSDRLAREIMVPRVAVIAIPWRIEEADLMSLIEANQHTRYPVTKDDKDNIVGYVHVRDLFLQHQSGHVQMENVLRGVIRIPETTQISRVLQLMQKSRTQLAIVVDEFGGTAGLVTLEDIIEELVGEIQDEFDADLPSVLKTTEGYSLDGRMLIRDVNELIGTSIEDTQVDTLGGWMLASLGRMPVVGDVVEIAGVQFDVARSEHRSVTRVVVRPPLVSHSDQHHSEQDSTEDSRERMSPMDT